MVRTLAYWCVSLTTVLCVAATTVEDSLQAGYRAYLAQEYDTAIRHYEQAMLSSDDPGRIACELGAILAKADRYQDAAQYFGRSLEDAHGDRRVKAAYGQGTALTKVAEQLQGRRAVAVLQRALSCYEIAIREIETMPTEVGSGSSLKQDAEHNRAVAQALLARKQQEPDPPDNLDESDPLPLLNPSMSDPGSNPARGNNAVPLNNRQPQGGGTESGKNESSAGKGNLPPLPDDDQTSPISPEEAHRRLNDLLKRLRSPQSPSPNKPGTRDW